MTRGSDTDAIQAARDTGLAAFNAGDVGMMIDVWFKWGRGETLMV